MATQVSVITRNGTTAYTLTTGGRGPAGRDGEAAASVPITAESINAALENETLEGVIFNLADVSGLGAALPLGSLARDAAGNPVIGNGITVPGAVIGNPNTYRFTGSIQLGDADVDIRRLLTLGTFPIPAAKAVVGGRLHWRGRMWGVSNGANLGIKIGIAGSAGTLPVEGSATPASSQRFYGFTLGVPDVGTIADQILAGQMVFTDSSGLLALSDGLTVAPSGFRDSFLASVFTRAAVTVSPNSSAKVSPGVDGVMSLYFGTEAGLTVTSYRMEYDFEFTWA